MNTNGLQADRISEAGADRAAIADTTVLLQVGDVPPDRVLHHPVAPLCQGLAALGFKAIHLHGAIDYFDELARCTQGAPFFQEPGTWLDEDSLEQAPPADIIVDLTNDPKLSSLCARLTAAQGAYLISLAWGRTWLRLHCSPRAELTICEPGSPGAGAVVACLPLSRIAAGLALQEALMHAGSVQKAAPADPGVIYNVGSDTRTGMQDDSAWSHLCVENAVVELIGVGGIGVPFLDAFAPLLGEGCELRIFDQDIVGAENLASQLLYTPDDLGQPKAVVAADRLSAHCHPAARVQAYAIRYQERPPWLSTPSLRVSAVDNFAAREYVNDLSVADGVPFVDAGSSPLAARQTTYYPGRTSCLRCRIHNLASLAAAEESGTSCSRLLALTLPGTNIIIGSVLAGEALRALKPTAYGWPSRGTIVYDARFRERFGVIDDRPPCRHPRVREGPQSRHRHRVSVRCLNRNSGTSKETSDDQKSESCQTSLEPLRPQRLKTQKRRKPYGAPDSV